MTADNDTNESGTGRLIGALLREARKKTGMSVSEVSRALRIRQVYLEAIEADDYASLPGKTYVLGFLRSYADLLGLDSEDVAQRYRRQTEYSSLPQSPLNFPARDLESRMPRGAVIVLSLLLAAGAIYGGTRYFGADDSHRVDRVAPVPDRLIAGDQATPQPTPAPAYVPRQDPASAYAAQMPQSNDEPPKPTPVAANPLSDIPVPQIDSSTVPQALIADAPTAAPAAVTPPPAVVPPPAVAPAKPATTASKPGDKPSDKPTAAAAKPGDKPNPAANQTASLPPAGDEQPKPRDVVVVARVDSWIEVRDLNNRPLVSLLLRVGDSYRVPSGANYRLVTGDLRGLEVRIDGIAVPQKSVEDGHLHRTMSLDTDRLRNGNGVVE
jgi:cytoskeleton protein RodZ